jgi:hypothetical protein
LNATAGYVVSAAVPDNKQNCGKKTDTRPGVDANREKLCL